jgi:hypothetical protein
MIGGAKGDRTPDLTTASRGSPLITHQHTVMFFMESIINGCAVGFPVKDRVNSQRPGASLVGTSFQTKTSLSLSA